MDRINKQPIQPISWKTIINTILKSTRTGPRSRIEADIQLYGINKKLKKRIRPQNTIFSAEQGAISSIIHATMGDPRRIVIATDSLSTLLAASDKKVTKNPKTRKIRKLLEQKGDKITLLWVPSHAGIPGNEKVDSAAKEALDEPKGTPH
jgi:hypothetical protein